MPELQIELPPEAETFVNRVRKVEGTAGGTGYVKYGNTPFTPDKDFPAWEGVDLGDGKKTHAAGPGQWQPDTWKEVKGKFKGYGVDLDFSNEQHQKAAIWEKGYEDYKKATGGGDLREDLKANKVKWDKLSGTWQGFTPRVIESDKPGGKIDQRAIAYEQSRPHQSVWYMDPKELLAQLPEQSEEEERPKRRSLRKSLELGEDIYDLPEIQVSDKGNTRKISDWDGRNRLQAMIDAGLTAVPVVVKGLEPGVRPEALEGMTGKSMPIRFDPVPTVARQGIRGAGGDLAGSQRFYSGIRSGLENVGQTISHTIPTGSPGAAAGQQRLDQAIAQRQSQLQSGGQTAWPYAAGQTVGSAIPAMAVPIAGALPARMALGAAGGAVAGAGEGVAAPENFWSEKLPQMGAGAVGGAVGVPVAETAARTLGAVPNMLRWLTGQGPSGQQQVERFLSQLGSMTQSENRARDVLSQRFAEDAAAGGPSAEEAAARMERARGEGLPMTLADVGGENVRAVVGSAGRAGGPARGRLARWAVGRLGSVERDSPLMTNIEEGIEKYLATGSARTEARALAEQRAAAAPLWQTAMEGGNLVPVERTLAQEYGAATRAAEQAGRTVDKEGERLAEMERRARDQDVRVPREPRRLNSFLVREGGLRDESGELSHITGGAKGRPALINNASGLSLDEATLRAWQEGYLEGVERPTTADLLDAIAQDHNVGPIYSSRDDEAALAHHDARESNRAADQRRATRPLPEGKKISAGELQFQRDKVADLRAQQARAVEDQRLYAETIRRGQEDGTIGLNNAVWSPRLARLLKNPRVVSGINRGARIERDIADGEGRVFRPRDYAITGEDREGNPTVGAVPNMKLLAVAKEGLDATLESDAMRDGLTGRLNKEGRAVKLLRDGLVDELDRLNPDYKIARDKWAGDSALISAIRDGRAFHKTSPEEIAEWFGKASESEQQAFRVGAADTLRDDISRAAFGGDPSNRLINNARLRRQILPMFRSADDAEKFLARVQDARTMAQTPSDILRGSPTAARTAEDAANRGGFESVANAMHILAGAASGHPHAMLGALGRSGRSFMNTPDVQAVNDAIVRLALDPSLRLDTRTGNALRRLRPLPQVQRSAAVRRIAAALGGGLASDQMRQR